MRRAAALARRLLTALARPPARPTRDTAARKETRRLTLPCSAAGQERYRAITNA